MQVGVRRLTDAAHADRYRAPQWAAGGGRRQPQRGDCEYSNHDHRFDLPWLTNGR
jgi:hypothetical protein